MTKSTVSLTPWFNAITQKPVRRGLYEFKDALWKQRLMVLWNGRAWTWLNKKPFSACNGDKWRGILGDV